MELKKNEILVLKKVKEDKDGLYTNYNNVRFDYPRRGWVEAPDWENTSECGNGLHGLAWGCGNHDINDYGTVFLILRVNKKDGFIDLEDKIKFRRGYVVKATNYSTVAIQLLEKHAPLELIHNYDISDRSAQNAGYRSTQNAGNRSTQNAGHSSTQNAGYSSAQNAGHSSTQNAGDSSTQNTGHSSTQNAGDSSTQNTGHSSTQNAGYSSTQNAGNSSTQNAGYRSAQNTWHSSTQNAGHSSTQNAGNRSTQNAGHSSTQNAWNSSTQNAGYRSAQNAGNSSTQNAGHSSTQNAGNSSTANQGNNSISAIHGGDCIYRTSGVNSLMVMFNGNRRHLFLCGKDFQPNETIKIVDNKIKYRYTDTPDNIIESQKHEIFVFGSNLAGKPNGGAARIATDKFGAVDGIGEGLQGNSYAFPTLTRGMKQRTMVNLKKSVQRLIDCANANTDKIFLITKVGCGIAGYPEEEMKSLFRTRNDISANIILPSGWRR